VPPTTRHLKDLIGRMQAGKVGVILSSPYFERRHAEFVARATGGRVVPMVHQTGARPGAETYLEMVAYNGRQLLEALAAKP
jgi:ABC-type Zn uptake system ZnuABC Zn-binding protein ZnuA